jgi:CheY-like chemotaxis protein
MTGHHHHDSEDNTSCRAASGLPTRIDRSSRQRHAIEAHSRSEDMSKVGARLASGPFFWRYFVPLAIFIVVGVALPIVLVVPGQRAQLQERARADTILTAKLAGRVFASILATGRVGDLRNEMAALRRTYDVFGWMAVTGPTGKILAHTDATQEGKLDVDVFPPPVSIIVRSARGSHGEPRLDVTLPLTSGGEVRGTLRTEMRIDTPAGVWTGIEHIVALTACLLGLASLLSLHLARGQTTARTVVRERVVPERSDERAAAPVTASAQPLNELLAAMIEATPAGLFAVDEVTRKVHHVNGAFCRLWGLEAMEAQLRSGSADYDSIAPQCNAAAAPLVLPPLGTTDLDPLRLIDEELRCRDGRTVHCFSLPLSLGGRHVRLYVHTDITAERRREQELTQAVTAAQTAFQEKTAFHAQVSRTLRAPLNGLLGTVGLLSDTTKLTAQQSTYVETVRGSGEDVLAMVNNLLDLTAIDAGELHLSSSAFSLPHVVHESLVPFALIAHRKSIDLAAVIADGVPRGCCGDSDRLQQVLTNLVASAIQSTEHGEVVINVSPAPAEMAISTAGIRIANDGARSRGPHGRQGNTRVTLRFEVCDTGRGITPDEQASLFQIMGAQAAEAQYRTHLPLLVAKRLVELMGGQVGVESDPGRGKTLWCTVPLQVDAQAKDDVAPSVDTFNAGRVLVVDDNATVRALLEQQLRAWHLTSEGAASGEEALKLLRTAADYGTPYSLAIIDAQMPEMDGLTLAEAIRREARHAGMQVFLLTSSPQVSGDTYPDITAVLSKPVLPSSLYEALVTHLGAKNGQRRAVASAMSRRGRPRGRLLLAEDNLVNQKIALRMLDKLGYITDVVANGGEAVEAAGRVDYDAILMDCQMPEMDGVTAAKTIRQHEGSERHVPIIAVTANSLSADRERCLAAGMDDFLAKPVRAADIEAVLTRWTVPADGSERSAIEGTLRLAPTAQSA